MKFATPKPFSQSSEENKTVIFESIHPYLANKSSVLEIASGTGQHAVYFSSQLPHLTWQTSDLIESHSGICQWLDEADLPNIHRPVELNVSESQWPDCKYDAVFSANSFHIMSQQNVVDFFANIADVLQEGAHVLIYGPFNYNNAFTSESNANFDVWLKHRNPQSGIKDFEWCHQLAMDAGLILENDIEMPVNNRILVWSKSE
ncbi:DUF938 domain-containing protein [Thiomicrorhabdus indica]|uniref:DUF938 domain-containing protein n=1 Tax=Thiomicrorhabdus indica TaxID=2267253 RepID=UPI002AA8EF71|nr:DUF938 domain-containing protein [Thiomicrorhabdus indica]